MATEKTRKAVIDAFMALLGEKTFDNIGLDDIAARAGIGLGDLRGAFDGKIAILAEMGRRADRAVLDAAGPAEGTDSARDRLFDLTMRRLDRLAPEKAAIRHLRKSARRDPALALCLNALALRSARFMLAAAGVGTSGPAGALRTQGYVLILARLLPTWLDDTDPDQSRTLAALDRALEDAETWAKRSDRVLGALCSIGRRLERRRRPPRERESAAA